MHKAEKEQPATHELAELVAQRMQANPALTREVIVGEIFQANPDLYERVRAESTVDGHGRTLREAYGKVSVSKVDSIDHDLARRVENLVSKTAGSTPEQAAAFLFKSDAALYERWRNESHG